MPTFHRASTGDTVEVPKELEKKYAADPAWEPVKKSAKSATDSEEKKA